MQEFGCRTVDGTAFGQKDGLPYSAQLQPGPGTPLLFQFAAQQDTAPLAKQLQKEKQPHLRWFSQKDGEGYTLGAVYSPPSDFYAKSGVHSLLLQVAALGRQGLLAPPQTCPLCGLGSPDACACLEDVYRPVHAACVDTRLKLPEKDTVVPAAAGGHVVTGILGALVGAFIGALPIFTFALNDGIIHWILYAFIPILAALCYRLLRGRASAAVAGVTVLAASLLAAFGLELIWFWLVLSAQHGQTLPFFLSTQRYFATHTLLLTVKEMLACLLALLAGYLASTIFLRRYVQDGAIPSHVIHGAAFVRSTLTPIAPRQGGEEGGGEENREEPTQGDPHGTKPADPS